MNNYKYMDEIFLDEIKEMDSIDLKLNKKLFIEKIDNGCIYPRGKDSDGGVVDSNGNFVELSKVNAYLKHDCFGGKQNKGIINNNYKITESSSPNLVP